MKSQKKQEVSEDTAIRVCQSLIAAIKIIAEFRRSSSIKAFVKSSKLKTTFKNLKIFVSLNFGWAIEGALGFTDRAEAVYLSPLIDETIHLTNIGRKLGVVLTMTSDFYHFLTYKGKLYIRELGNFRWCEQRASKSVYSFDIKDIIVEVMNEDEKEVKIGEMRPKEKYQDTIIDMKDANSFTFDIIFVIDLDMEGLIGYNEEHYALFREALSLFIGKEWGRAKQLFTKCGPRDFMAKAYIEHIDDVGEPIADWDGTVDIRKYIHD